MIREDKSYLSSSDLLAIEKGFAKLDIYSIRVDREQLTEEEKAENLRIANSVSTEEWNKYCNQNKKKIESKIEPFIEKLSENFNIYQYKDKTIVPYKSNWDLFFWCNTDNEGRDFSYVTLDMNKNRTVEERFLTLEYVIKYIKKIGFQGIDIIIQYTVKYDDEKIKQEADNYFEKVKNTFVRYMGMDGRIKEVGKDVQENKCYGFFKKGAKTKYYKLSLKNIAMMSIQC